MRELRPLKGWEKKELETLLELISEPCDGDVDPELPYAAFGDARALQIAEYAESQGMHTARFAVEVLKAECVCVARSPRIGCGGAA